MTAELDVNQTPDPTAPFTDEETAEIRIGLVAEIDRLRAEIALVDGEISEAVAESSIGVLHDELDLASNRAELLQDAVRATNATAILEQTVHVLERLDAGLYGLCEGCSGAIGRPRLEAFPRAKMCMTCVH